MASISLMPAIPPSSVTTDHLLETWHQYACISNRFIKRGYTSEDWHMQMCYNTGLLLLIDALTCVVAGPREGKCNYLQQLV